MTDDARRRIASCNGMVPGTVLVDGLVHGTWRIDRRGPAATLLVAPFAPLAPPDRDALADEGARLLAFAAPDAPDAPDARTLEVRFAPAP